MKRTVDYRAWLVGGASVLALGIVTAGAAVAQSAPPAPEVDDGDHVVIVGQTIEETLPQELAKYGSSVEVTGSEEMRNSGFVDVSQALQMDTPGLHLAPRGGPFSYLDISIQGSRTQDMLFLVDGVRINNRLYSGTITDTLPGSMVERVEVLKGGQGLFYGTQAVAGVINVVTRGYTDEFDGQVNVGGDTNDSIHADAFVRGKAGPGNYVLYASQDKSDGIVAYTRSNPSATDKNRSYDVNSAGAKYRLEFGDRLSLDARYQHTDARLDYPAVTRTRFAKNERDEEIASLGVNYQAAEWAELLVKGYWHDWDSHYTTINNTVNGATGAITGQVVADNQAFWGYDDRGINALAKLTPMKGFEYLVGYDFQQYSGRDDVLVIKPLKEEVNAVFAQVRTTPDLIDKGAFAAGVRYNDTGGVTATVWNVSGRYDFTDYFYAQGNIGTAFILPTAEQVYAQDLDDPLGNPNLEPEESENYNVSVGGKFGGDGQMWAWEATYFNRKIDNLISSAQFDDPLVNLDPRVLYPSLADGDTDPDGTPPFPGAVLDNPYYDDGIFFNLPGEVRVSGFEVITRAQFDNGVSLDASYTRSESESENRAGAVSQIQRIPAQYVKAGFTYQDPSGRWGLNSHALWTGSQLASVNSFGLQDYGEYLVVDLAGHVYLDEAEHHKLTIRIGNILDEDYVTRVNSSPTDITGEPRFLYGNRGVPRTTSVTYTYDF